MSVASLKLIAVFEYLSAIIVVSILYTLIINHEYGYQMISYLRKSISICLIRMMIHLKRESAI